MRGEVLINADGSIPESRDKAIIETPVSFQCPCFAGVIQKGLSIVCNGLFISVDDDYRLIMFWARGPFMRNVDCFRVTDGDDAIIFESDCPGPRRRNTGARGLEEGPRPYNSNYRHLPPRARIIS